MKIKINFSEILARAWQITWKFKVLWIFGILAGCAESGNSNFNFNNTNRWNAGNGSGGSGQLPDWMRRFQGMSNEQALRAFVDQYIGIIAAVLVLLCLLWAVFFFLGMLGKTALIKGVGKADTGTERMTFGELWTESLPYFWRMLGMSLLVGLPFFIITIALLAVLGVGVFATLQGNLPDGGIAAILIGLAGVTLTGLCVVGLLGMLVGLIVEQAKNALVLENLGVIPGLRRGWDVFRQNWLSVFVLGVLQSVIGLVVGIVLLVPLLILIVPVAIGLGAAAVAEQWIIFAVLIVGCLIFWLPIGLLLGGIERTYIQSLWTLAYRRLTALPEVAPAPIESTEPK